MRILGCPLVILLLLLQLSLLLESFLVLLRIWRNQPDTALRVRVVFMRDAMMSFEQVSSRKCCTAKANKRLLLGI